MTGSAIGAILTRLVAIILVPGSWREVVVVGERSWRRALQAAVTVLLLMTTPAEGKWHTSPGLAPNRGGGNGDGWLGGDQASGGVHGPVLGAGAIGVGRMWVWELSGLYLTVDSGAHWDDITPQRSGDPANILAVQFLNASDAWMAIAVPEGEAGVRVWRTTDSGREWSAARLPGSVKLGVNSAYLDFLGTRAGFALVQLYHPKGYPGKGELFYTTNGGAVWSEVDGDAPVDTGVWFTNGLDGVGTDSARRLWRTTDGGKKWVQVTVVPELPT